MSDYDPSQLLVNALQNACTKIQEQQQQLSEARKKMEILQTMSPSGEAMGRKRTYEQSIDCAIKAWRSTTAAYAEILQALSTATAVQPSASQMEQRRVTELAELGTIASEARSASHKFVLYEELVHPNSDRASAPGLNDLEEVQRQAAHSRQEQATHPSELYEELSMRARANGAVENESKPEFPRENVSHGGDGDAEKIPNLAAASHVVPKVEYEDVSAEVEARLKAKEATKAAAQKEKKRKRESGESLAEGGMNGGKTDKPAKKKVKAEIGDEEVAHVSRSEKTNKHDLEDEDALDTYSRRKRQKLAKCT